DQDGNQIGSYLVDPRGSFVEGRSATSGGQRTAEAATGRAGAPTEVTADHQGTNWWLIALLATIVALLVGALAWWLLRSKVGPEPSWAEALVARLEREGARRGRPRRA